MECIKCNKGLQDGWKICPFCGTKVRSKEEIISDLVCRVERLEACLEVKIVDGQHRVSAIGILTTKRERNGGKHNDDRCKSKKVKNES